ncbi:MAG: hypothetical protein JXJ19_02040 [Elusimicrobia bacterium]|nr:hypothetical protein [Elusimicrobiota bacterium]
MRNRVYNKLVSIMGGIVLLCFSFLGMLNIPDNAIEGGLNNSLFLIKNTLVCHSQIVFLINRFIGQSSPVESGVPVKDKKDDNGRKRDLSKLVFFMMNSIAATTERSFFIMIASAMGVLMKKIKSLINLNIQLSRRFAAKVEYYKRTFISIVSPVKKCIESIIYKYGDSPSPEKYFLNGKTRTLYRKGSGVRVFLSDRTWK